MKAKEILIGVLCLIIFAAAYFYTLKMFDNESETKPTILYDKNEVEKDCILIGIQVTGVDPVKGDISARMNFKPQGNFSDDGGRTVNKDITLYVNSITGKSEHNFPKGKTMNPIEVTLEMYDGIVTDYPFDSHKADIEMLMTSKEQADSGQTKEEIVSVLKEINFVATVHGFKIEEFKEPSNPSDYETIELQIERTSSVVFFSVFVMVLMWFITICVVLIMLSVIVRNRKLEYSMFGFLATLLFALPALRNIQPFVPPLGCLSDYIAFFWAEGIVAAGLILMIFIWLKRPGVKQS